MCCLCGCDLRCLFACCFVLLFSLCVWVVLNVGNVAVMVVWSGVGLVGLVGSVCFWFDVGCWLFVWCCLFNGGGLLLIVLVK